MESVTDTVYLIQQLYHRSNEHVVTLEGIIEAVDDFLRLTQKSVRFGAFTDSDRDYMINELIRMNANIIH